jgi:hypothetical protein
VADAIDGQLVNQRVSEGAAGEAQRTPAGALRFLAPIVLAGALLLGWAFLIRANNDYPPLDWAALGSLAFDPWVVGKAAQEMLLPVALLFLFSRWSLFRRCISGDPAAEGLRGRLLLVLLGGQLLYGLYQFGLIRSTESAVSLGLVIAVAGGVLGGWPVGLGVGAAALATNAALSYFPWPDVEPIDWDTFVSWYVLFNMDALVALWAGVVAGLASPWLRRPPRFALRKLLPVVLGIDLFAALCLFVASDSDTWVIERLLPNLAVAALATVALYLMARDVLDDANRRQAETAQLDLAEANLALAQTKLALAQAELRALQAQINPHFLFNSLNTIRYFIRTDPAQARDLLTSLSELFQRALRAGEFVSLREEISHVEAYLSLEQARLDERLQVIWTNLARGALEAPVPTLVLQPLVENAVIHGISPKPQGGVLHIVINQLGGDLMIQVDDNGMGFDARDWRTAAPTSAARTAPNAAAPASHAGQDAAQVLMAGMHTWEAPVQRQQPAEAVVPSVRASIGLRNVDERLRMLYGEEYGLHVESAPGKGTRVVLRVPLREPLPTAAHANGQE